MVSLQESVFHAIPVLGIPLTYEQKLNKDIVLAKNIGMGNMNRNLFVF